MLTQSSGNKSSTRQQRQEQQSRSRCSDAQVSCDVASACVVKVRQGESHVTGRSEGAKVGDVVQQAVASNPGARHQPVGYA